MYLCSMETFNIILPTSWAEMDDKQLLMVYNLFARDLSATEVKTLCLMKWNDLKVLATLPSHRYLIKRKHEPGIVLNCQQVLQATTALDFLDSLAPMPVRIAKIGKHHALPADFEKVSFEQFLYVENLFQGYLNTQADDLLLQMAQVLYASDHVKPSKGHLVGIFYWMASLKQFFAGLFPNFYKPASPSSDTNLLGSSSDIYSQLRESTNAMIRALTGGDITKEEQILKMDTWRALTELDAKAKEADDLRKATKKP